MARSYYHKSVSSFLEEPPESIIGTLALHHEFSLEEAQRNAWQEQIRLLKNWLKPVDGDLLFEYSIPRMGRRIDCVLLSGGIVFAIEFKVGSTSYDAAALDQVMDYALDLKNFHEQSHDKIIVPILICTAAPSIAISPDLFDDQIAKPVKSNGTGLSELVHLFVRSFSQPSINPVAWLESIYKPTPTIIEAAQALYRGHSVHEISRSDSGAMNLSRTAAAISSIIDRSKRENLKSICFITGVPGAGKTLAGLNLANTWHDPSESEHAVFLSGNGPLVDVLREALARNEVATGKEVGVRRKKGETVSKAKAFIQNIHHFRDDALNTSKPPIERVVIFDEAQRAWTLKQTADFMRTKKGKIDFSQSEPEFLISVMDRHQDWATIVCLIGGGQEINTGEAGIREWFKSLKRSFPHWGIYISSKLTDYEYTQGEPLYTKQDLHRVRSNDDLHLSVSVRSFRSENVSSLVKAVLDVNIETALRLATEVRKSYPIFITRDLIEAKKWLRARARGTERFGIVASSGAMRLRPYGIHVKSSMVPVYWFLNAKEDIRSSYFLEDVATEFDIQGLELDWTCVAWDADLRFQDNEWNLKSFRGTTWQEVNDSDARLYLKNAYRVLLIRARQGMVIFVPKGNRADQTRLPEFYDGTYRYLKSIGFSELPVAEK